MKMNEIYSITFVFVLFLTDSIKSSVGNKVKILFKNVVRLETKGDKTENRVLVSINYIEFNLYQCAFSLSYIEILNVPPLRDTLLLLCWQCVKLSRMLVIVPPIWET